MQSVWAGKSLLNERTLHMKSEEEIVYTGDPNEEVPQELFEVDPEMENREPTIFDHLRSYATIVIVVLVIMGLVGIGGVYQYFQFFETSHVVEEQATPIVVGVTQLTVPLTFFILRGANGSERDDASVNHLFANGQEIWNQANIILSVVNEYEVVVNEDEMNIFYENPRAFMGSLPGYDPGTINVLLVRTLRGINGIAFPGFNSIAVADRTTVFDFRAFAHEIGHILGLAHIPNDRTLLMFQGANGSILTQDEIKIARERAARF